MTKPFELSKLEAVATRRCTLGEEVTSLVVAAMCSGREEEGTVKGEVGTCRDKEEVETVTVVVEICSGMAVVEGMCSGRGEVEMVMVVVGMCSGMAVVET